MPRLRIVMQLHLFAALLLAAAGAPSADAASRGTRNGGLAGLAFYPVNPPVLPVAKTNILFSCSIPQTFSATDWFSSYLSPPQALLMLIRISNATTSNGGTMVFVVNGDLTYTAQVVSSLSFGPPQPTTSSLVLVYLTGAASFSLSAAICSPGPAVAYVSLQMQGYFAPAQVGGSNGAYRYNALARTMPSPPPFTRYLLGSVNLYPKDPLGPPCTLMIWDQTLPVPGLIAYANLGDASNVSHSFMSRVSDANSLALSSPVNVPPEVTYKQVGSFDPVGSDFFSLLGGSYSMRLVDTRGGDAAYLTIAAPLPITTNQTGTIAARVVAAVPAWADALVCHIMVGSNNPVGLAPGKVSANGNVVYVFPYTKYSGDFAILPIDASTGSISLSVSVDVVPIVVDCFGFTGTEPLLDPNAGAPSFFNLQFIPLIKPVRLMESWLQQMSLMAAKGLPNPLQPNVAYLLNALDVARAIGDNNTLRYPRAMACSLSVVSKSGSAINVDLWEADLGPNFTPARHRLQCFANDSYCAASVTQRLSRSAQFYFMFTPLTADLTIRIAIDVFGFYFDGTDGYMWQPLFAPPSTFVFPAATTQAMDLQGNNGVAAITYRGDKSSNGVLAHTFHSESIVTAYPDLNPTLAWSVVSSLSTSFTGVAAVTPASEVTMSADCALTAFPMPCGAVPMIALAPTGVFVAPSPAGLVYTPFQEPIPFLGTLPSGLPPLADVLAYNISELPFYNVPPTVNVSFLLCAFTVPSSAPVWTLYERSVSPMYKLLGIFSTPHGAYRAEVFVALNATSFVNLGFSDLTTPVTAEIVGYFASPTPLSPPTTPTLTTPAPTTPPPTTQPPSTPPPTTPQPSTTPPPAPPTILPVTTPPQTTVSRPTQSPPPASPLPPSPPLVTTVPCTGPPPVANAWCVGGAWWVPSLEVITLNISFEPIVIGTDVHMGPESVTVITPTYNSTIFIVANGAATIDGTLIVDLSGRVYNATYTTLAVVRAGALSGGYDTIAVSNTPKSCERYSAWTAQTSTTLNAVLLRDDSNCKKSGLGKWAAVAGGVVFGLTLIAIATLLLLLRCGVITPSSFLFLRRNEDGNSIN